MSANYVVLKFGGTSVASAERWQQIARIASERRASGFRVAIVVSALDGVTDLIDTAVASACRGDDSDALQQIRARHLHLAGELGIADLALEPVLDQIEQLAGWLEGIRLTGEAPPRLVARCLAVGELASSTFGVSALGVLGIDARWVDARELLTSSEAVARSAEFRYLEATAAPRSAPAEFERVSGGAEVCIVPGFVARTPAGDTCVLGRGGSDTSATLIGALVKAGHVEIWTDVPGVFTTNPRVDPTARLIRQLSYRQARELAAMGASVLHPHCVSIASQAQLPLHVGWMERPEIEGTRVEPADETRPTVTAVSSRPGGTLLTISTLAMWETPGFLAKAFTPFEQLGISIDLVGTSEAAVSVTLDRVPGGVEGAAFTELIARLEPLGKVEVIHPCAIVSIVGRKIRAALHQLGPALEVFRERSVHLVTNSSEDLNLSFVVDEHEADQLVSRLHQRLFSVQGDDTRLGPTWESLQRKQPEAERLTAGAWWRAERERLLPLCEDGDARFVYHLPTVASQARALREHVGEIAELFYSMKANSHAEVLKTIAGEGFGIECVSAGEMRHARAVLGERCRLLFTPNLCPVHEYAEAFELGAEATVDGPAPLELAPEIFDGREIALRIDPGHGLGHHEKVRTAGAHAKFGQASEELSPLLELVERCGAKVVGLHAHVGSGIMDPLAWARTGQQLAELRESVPGVKWIDLGGGLGVPERPGQGELDLRALAEGLGSLARTLGDVQLRLEPGRFLASEAGVLIAPVSQVRSKGGVRFVGLTTGMNSLIRPTLYGAWHGIHNLSRLNEAPSGYWHVVGPICESGDVLGRDRLLPETRVGDVLLVENAGAYGAVMASRYNLREPATEVCLQ